MFRGTSLFLLGCLFISISSISIPLVRNINRCMIVYTSSPDQYMILDMKFPTVPDIQSSESFKVTIFNTQDKSLTEEQVKPGTFRRQLDLQESVVYKICFAFLSNRSIGNIIIEYNAETRFSQQIQTVKIPQTLLKSEDFKNTYGYAENIYILTEATIEYQKDKRKKQDIIYLQNKKNIDTLYWISVFEIAVILLTGIYQFFNVRNFLITKQYL